MFYKGYLELNPARFQRVIFTRDPHKNSYHTRAHWVKLAETSIRLGHLSRGAAEACMVLYICQQNPHSTVFRVSGTTQ